MIYTKKENLQRYKGINDNLDIAIDTILNGKISQFEMGRNEIDGNQVYFNRFDYETVPLGDAAFEAHKLYADVHMLLSGEERIGVSHIDKIHLSPYDEETDSYTGTGLIENMVQMTTEDILIVFPEDAHKVKIQLHNVEKVQKVVGKVMV